MRRDAPRQHGPNRMRRFEKVNAKLGFDQILHEAAQRTAKTERRNSVYGDAIIRSRVERALKLAKKVRAAEKQLELAKSQPPGPYEGLYFEAYERHMPIKINNEAYRVGRRRMHLTEDQMYAIATHPELFPNPRLVYCFFDQSYRIDWDGKP